MAAKPTHKIKPVKATRPERAPAIKWLLSLSLVPLVIGVLLIGAWMLDMEVISPADNQITVGALFILASFALSNALQKNWLLAAGWALLAVADFVILTWLDVLAQRIAFSVAAVGLVFLAMEFYRRFRNRPRTQ